jgi:hypothetical protein
MLDQYQHFEHPFLKSLRNATCGKLLHNLSIYFICLISLIPKYQLRLQFCLRKKAVKAVDFLVLSGA